VDALPPHHRLVFMLREVEGLSTATPPALGIAEDAAKCGFTGAGGLRRTLTETSRLRRRGVPVHRRAATGSWRAVMEAIARVG